MLQGRVVSSTLIWRQYQPNPHTDDREPAILAIAPYFEIMRAFVQFLEPIANNKELAARQSQPGR